jgi:hypothetical protein
MLVEGFEVFATLAIAESRHLDWISFVGPDAGHPTATATSATLLKMTLHITPAVWFDARGHHPKAARSRRGIGR